MPKDEQRDYHLRSLRARVNSTVSEAVRALRASNPDMQLSEAQSLNTILQRGARAVLADLELGGNLKLGQVDEDGEGRG